MECTRCGFKENFPLKFYQINDKIFCKSCMVWFRDITSDIRLISDINTAIGSFTIGGLNGLSSCE